MKKEDIQDGIMILLVIIFLLLGLFFIGTVALQLTFGPIKNIYCPVEDSCVPYMIGRFVFGILSFVMAGLVIVYASVSNVCVIKIKLKNVLSLK